MTEELLNRARAALDGVTPGPWEVVQRDHFTFIKESKYVDSYDVDHLARVFASKHNARFIAAARDLVPELAAALEKAEAERDSFRAVLEGARYGNIEGIAKNTPEFSRQLGEAVMELTVARMKRAETAEAALAQASDPDFILAAMLDVADMDMQLADYAEAVAKAIAALCDKEAGDE